MKNVRLSKKFLATAVIISISMAVGQSKTVAYANEKSTALNQSVTGKASINQAKVSINGGEAVTLPAYKVDGYNYLRIRDLCKALDFYVGHGYDENNEILVFFDTMKSYLEDDSSVLPPLTKDGVDVKINETIVACNGYEKKINGFIFDNRTYFKLQDLSDLTVYAKTQATGTTMKIFTLNYIPETAVIEINIDGSSNENITAMPSPEPTSTSTQTESSTETGYQYLVGEYKIDSNGSRVYPDGSRISNIETSYGNHSFSEVKDLDENGFALIDGIKVRQNIGKNDKGNTVISYDTLEKDQYGYGVTIKTIWFGKYYESLHNSEPSPPFTEPPVIGSYPAKIFIDESQPVYISGYDNYGVYHERRHLNWDNLTAPYKNANVDTCTGYAEGRFKEVNGFDPEYGIDVFYNPQISDLESKVSPRLNIITDVNAIVDRCILVWRKHVLFVEYIERDSSGKPVNIYYTDSGFIGEVFKVNGENGKVRVMPMSEVEDLFYGFLGYVAPK